MSASASCAPVRLARLRSAARKSTSRRSAFLKYALDRFALRRLAPRKRAPTIFAMKKLQDVQSQFSKIAPFNDADAKSTFVSTKDRRSRLDSVERARSIRASMWSPNRLYCRRHLFQAAGERFAISSRARSLVLRARDVGRIAAITTWRRDSLKAPSPKEQSKRSKSTKFTRVTHGAMAPGPAAFDLRVSLARSVFGR